MRIHAIVLSVFTPITLLAQGQPVPVPPQISTSATTEVTVKPDRATLVFTVESRGATAAKAGAETARKQRAVLDTLHVLGIAVDQALTAGIAINPEFVNPGENKPPRVAGYVARNSVRIEILKIDQAGALVDAALAKEATGIGSLQFTSSKLADARRQALELAVVKAKAEADAMARAAGGSLGVLIDLSAQQFYPNQAPAPMAFRASVDAFSPQTPIMAGEMTVSATVNGRWVYTVVPPNGG
jgi:uncharacterized protein YggE